MKGSKSDSTNYRPISVLPILARCFEKLIAEQLGEYCTINELVPKEQFGFRKNSNCEMALITAVDGWCKAIDNGELVGALLIDLIKEFHTVNHRIFLEELQMICCNHESMALHSIDLTQRKLQRSRHPLSDRLKIIQLQL